MGRTLKWFLNIATVGAEIRESGKLFQGLTTLFEKKWPANLVLVRTFWSVLLNLCGGGRRTCQLGFYTVHECTYKFPPDQFSASFFAVTPYRYLLCTGVNTSFAPFLNYQYFIW